MIKFIFSAFWFSPCCFILPVVIRNDLIKKFGVKSSRKKKFFKFYKSIKKTRVSFSETFTDKFYYTKLSNVDFPGMADDLPPLENCRFIPMTFPSCCGIDPMIFYIFIYQFVTFLQNFITKERDNLERFLPG